MRTLTDRFDFDDDAIDPGDQDLLQGTLWRVYDKDNGSAERRLRTWRKTGTQIDHELRNLWRHEMRQVRRLMRYRDADDVIVDALEELEDDHEFALLLADRGEPLTISQVRSGRRAQVVPNGRKRILIWQNISRVARALGILHDQAIVHGRLTPACVFTENSNEPDFCLSGFEWSVRLAADTEAGPAAHAWSRFALPCSFREDWAALGRIAAQLLCEDQLLDSVASVDSLATDLERNVFSLLVVPRPNQPLDAEIVIRTIDAAIADLRRLESGRRGELVLLPNPSTLGTALVKRLGIAIDPDDFTAHCRWLEADLRTDVRVAPRFANDERMQCELVTDNFRYVVEPPHGMDDWRIGFLKSIIPNDGRGTGTSEPRQLHSPIRVVPNRREALDTVRRLGPSAIEWDPFSKPPESSSLEPADVRDALLAIEVIEAVAATLNAFPVVLDEFDALNQRITVRLDPDDSHCELVEKAGLRPDAERLADMLDLEDDIPWRLSNSPKLGWDAHGDSDVEFVERRNGPKGIQYIFQGVEPPDAPLFLKPPRDLGTESAVRRRLRNIMMLHGRTDVTIGLDDPWTTRRLRRAQELSGASDDSLDTPKRKTLELIAQTEPYVYVVGPPGVGKTYLVARMLAQILSSKPEARILVSAQSHEALKNIHDTLNAALDERSIIVRVGNDENRFSELDTTAINALKRIRGSAAVSNTAFSKYRNSLDQTLEAYDRDQRSRPQMLSRVGDLIMHSANVVLAGLNSMTVSDFVEASEEFDWVIVEEAARATGPELAGALALAPRKILIGDHNQLPPHRADEVARRFEPLIAHRLLSMAEDRLGFSPDIDELLVLLQALVADDSRFQTTLGRANRLLEPFRTIVTEDERGMQLNGDRHRPISMTLTEQRRMDPTIAAIVSNVFYSGQLTTAKEISERTPPFRTIAAMPKEPVVVIDFPSLMSTNRVDPFERRHGKSPSNPSEVVEIVHALKHLEGIPEREPTLAVLTPYNGQVELLKQRLNQAFPETGAPKGFRPVRGDLGFVGTVDAFQGSEADVVLLSLVRNNKMVGGRALGFLRDRRRMNVALSRAKHKLIVVTSTQFLDLAAKGMDPKGMDPKWTFLRSLVNELRSRNDSNGGVGILAPGALN